MRKSTITISPYDNASLRFLRCLEPQRTNWTKNASQMPRPKPPSATGLLMFNIASVLAVTEVE